MRPVVTAAEMYALDRATIDELGLPAIVLMETAGRAVAAAAERMVAAPRGHIAVVCGPGNNGGDGFVIARVLRERGLDAVAYRAVARAAITGDAATHLAILERGGGVVREVASAATLAEAADAIAGAALVVDALFGIGLTRPITGHLAELVAIMNRAARRLAVDLPSGVDTDTGRALGAAITADVTVTMAALKIAHASAPGFVRCGRVEVAEIGIPAALIAASHVGAMLVEDGDVAGWLPRAAPLDHKGTRGHVVVIGGSPGMRGAGRLAASAALRAGAGRCTLAAAPAADGELTAPDAIMVRALTSSAPGSLGALLDGKAAIVIGCGLGHDGAATAWIADVLAAGIPAVLDADALTLYAGRLPELAAAARGPIVLTPHPGEAARLLGTTIAAIEGDRLASARAIAAASRAVVVLKGARTIVCDGTLGDDHCSINPTGGGELATAGSGDVLAGTIGGLLAQGLSPHDAARAGVYVHGRAGDQLAALRGDRGLISSDLPRAIATAIHALTGRSRVSS